MYKTEEQIRDLPHVQDVWKESDYLWHVEFKDGWCSNSDPYGAMHSDAAETLSKLLKVAKDVRVCSCEDCKVVE